MLRTINHVECPPVTLSPGTRVGPYEISAQIGAGGMGEVYRARDTRLKRDVALKILPEFHAADSERLARFQLEAEVLASLNDPHIAGIYGVEERDGVKALVMELVEGPTLADRLASGPLSIAEALSVARQIAHALEASHEKGIIHRDLKPANIKLTSGGHVKVLDFGLAKVRERVGVDSSSLATQVTQSRVGTVLGTPAYMAPEQAQGLETNRAADVWAFGCVLFEMLAGKPAFQGRTATEILAEVLKADPDWKSLPTATPAAIQRVARRCLQKDVRDRFHDIADVRIDLDDASLTPATVLAKPSRTWVVHLVWAAAVVALVTIAFSLRRPAPTVRTELDVVTPPEADAGGIALASDGSKIAFTAMNNGVARLYARPLENRIARLLPGTEGAALPFWSPDGRALAFFADSKLKRIDLESLTIRPLAEATLSPAGGSWSKDGTILFSPNISGGVYQVSESGQGSPIRVVPDGRAPRFLEDGRRFLFASDPSTGQGTVFLSALGSSDRQRVLDGDYAMPGGAGYLVYTRQGALFIQGFDADRLTLTGVATRLAERVSASTDGASVSVTASSTGMIAFRDASIAGEQPRRLSWFDRSGTETRRVTDEGGVSPSLSPDEAYVAVGRHIDGAAVWLVDSARNFAERFTSGRANQTPLFSPDGREIVFSSARTRGGVQLFRRLVDGGEEFPLDLPNPSHNKVATDWTNDYLLYRENSPKTQFDIWALPQRGGDRKAFGVSRHRRANEMDSFRQTGNGSPTSPTNRERSDIYITRFPLPGREFLISTRGGAQVRWNPANQNEIFYISLNGRLATVALEFSANGQTVESAQFCRIVSNSHRNGCSRTPEAAIRGFT